MVVNGIAHRRDRAGHSLARAEIRAHHPRGVRQPGDRARDHGGARLPGGRAAQPDIDRIRGAVRRPRRRLRHPVQRALSRRPFRGRRSEARAGARRAQRRRAADARRRSDGRRLSLVPADRLSRRLRARADRRHGHAGRLSHQPHGAARAAEGAQSAGRARAARLRVPRAGRQVHGGPSHRDHRRRRDRVARRIAAALLPAVRLQPDQSAQSEGRVDRDLPRPAQAIRSPARTRSACSRPISRP